MKKKESKTENKPVRIKEVMAELRFIKAKHFGPVIKSGLSVKVKDEKDKKRIDKNKQERSRVWIVVFCDKFLEKARGQSLDKEQSIIKQKMIVCYH